MNRIQIKRNRRIKNTGKGFIIIENEIFYGEKYVKTVNVKFWMIYSNFCIWVNDSSKFGL